MNARIKAYRNPELLETVEEIVANEDRLACVGADGLLLEGVDLLFETMDFIRRHGGGDSGTGRRWG